MIYSQLKHYSRYVILGTPVKIALNVTLMLWLICANLSEKGETEGDSYTPMLNDVIIVTPQFLGKKHDVVAY